MSRLAHISARAARDLNRHVAYIARDSLDSTVRLIEAFQNTCKQPAANPGIGTPRQGRSKLLAHLRSWAIHGFLNYIIYFRKRRDGIEIVRLTHGAQSDNEKFDRR